MSSRCASASKSARLTVQGGVRASASCSRDVSRMVCPPPLRPSCSSLTTGAAALNDTPLRGGLRAILDRDRPRRPRELQAGTKKRRVVSRTKKHHEVGSQGWPSKGKSSLPMLDSEEAAQDGLCIKLQRPYRRHTNQRVAPSLA